MKEIRLTQGKVALVDDEDFTRANEFKWYAAFTRHKRKNGLPGNERWEARTMVRTESRRRILRLHHLVLNQTRRIDHVDGNPLNNQKSNLRLATAAQNIQNAHRVRHHSSRFKGVSVYRNGQIVAYAKDAGKTIHLGTFPTELDAAKAYDFEALSRYGAFARTNAALGLI